MTQHNKGDAEFGFIIIIFLVILFVVWYFTEGPTVEEGKKPFIIPGNDSQAPLHVYGPNEQPR